jgi:prolyl 4-hydroxylase
MSKTTQRITPELRKWIVEQAQAGHQPDAVLTSMKTSGWDEDTAVEALETTLTDYLSEQKKKNELPPAVNVPEPSLDGSPSTIDAGDRLVTVIMSMKSPRVVVFGNVMSDEECDEMIALADLVLAAACFSAAARTRSASVWKRGWPSC